ncbi:hypothetical protein [Agrobacterium rubi]|uniref:Tail fiber assembly protein n=1 Tax=Agrobacterium rubi TaxID=28099 RepID=A0ABX2IXV9_9HYPH|nr:hypothetical protein [Agrobacterium rubi]NTF35572.1 hypothetical protein [Agrobacterium rubi]
MQRYFVSPDGIYLGSYDGPDEEMPEMYIGATAVPIAPSDASQIWDAESGDFLPLPQPPYQIAKTTPWLRMTEDEAELITGAMQQANARQKAIYDAASYLSSGDPLWSTLHDMIALTLGSTSRADQLLAPEG